MAGERAEARRIAMTVLTKAVRLMGLILVEISRLSYHKEEDFQPWGLPPVR
jgi:hypothetical protein